MLLGTSSEAFVSKLSPFGGPIPCHQFSAAIGLYIEGVYTGGQLANALREEYLLTATPPQDWSATDNIDNANLATMINGITVADVEDPEAAAALTALFKYRRSVKIEEMCAAAEQQLNAVDTPEKFRLRIGLPPP